MKLFDLFLRGGKICLIYVLYVCPWYTGTGVVGVGGWGEELQFYSFTGAEKYSFTVLPGRRNTVLQYYIIFTI